MKKPGGLLYFAHGLSPVIRMVFRAPCVQCTREVGIMTDDQLPKGAGGLAHLLKVLTPEQVLEVDRALAAIGPFGEVRLIKVKGRLRFIQQLESRDIFQTTKPR